MSGGAAMVTDLLDLDMLDEECVEGGLEDGEGDCAREPGESSRVGHAPPPSLLSWLRRSLSRRNAFCLLLSAS